MYTITDIKKYILLIFSPLLFIGCSVSSSGLLEEKSENYIDVTLSLNNKGYNLPFNITRSIPNDEINSLRVYVFNNDSEGKFLYLAKTAQLGTGKFKVSLKKTEDRASINIIVVANGEQILPKENEEILSYADFNQKIAPLEIRESLVSLPLWGERTNVLINDKLTSLEINLIRPIAKFSVSLSADIPDNVFKIERIHLCNATIKGNVNFPVTDEGEAMIPYPKDERTSDVFSDIKIKDNGRETESYPIMENSVDQAPYLIIEGKFKNATENSFYKLNLKDITRNTNYVYYVTKVMDSGYPTLDEAKNSTENIIAHTVTWDDNITDTYYSDGNYFGVGGSYYDLSIYSEERIPYQTNIPIEKLNLDEEQDKHVKTTYEKGADNRGYFILNKIGKPSTINLIKKPYRFKYNTSADNWITLVEAVIYIGKDSFID